MKAEDQNDKDAETLSDLTLTTENGDEVKAGAGVNSAQLTIQGQISDSRAAGGHAEFHYMYDTISPS